MKRVLIAHRGEPDHWPENSLAGFRAALAAGAHYLETDVQLTADAVPILCHDATLLRVTGQDLEVGRTDWARIAALPAGEAGRFGSAFADTRIPRLADFVHLLAEWPQAQAFVELKRESLQRFGAAVVIERVLACLQPVLAQCILISFDAAVLAEIRRHHDVPIGWVLSEWSSASAATAAALAPDYLFCNRKRLPEAPAPLWTGPWQWVVYTVNDAAEIAPLLARGFRLVETNQISRLLAATDAADTGNRHV
ncbi:MAG: glycerophosphodiester phosphodiesterase family protein [Pseudomonadota bacterium]